MNDIIEIKDLIVFANHGVLPEEKKMGQKFSISMRLHIDTAEAARTDDINKAVNYSEVCAFVTEFTKQNSCKLIETAADNIAHALLMCYPSVSEVRITLKKPWAPIGLPLDSVAVEVSRKRSTAYIGVGSNMGDRRGYLDFAAAALDMSDGCKVCAVAEYIETEPYGGVAQDKFLNSCICIETILNPFELLALLHDIENEAGRTREVRWGPRTLDLDILLYDDAVICTDTLVIPHPEMTKREFVLAPLAQIAPYAYNPVAKDYAVNLLERIRNNGNARLL